MFCVAISTGSAYKTELSFRRKTAICGPQLRTFDWHTRPLKASYLLAFVVHELRVTPRCWAVDDKSMSGTQDVKNYTRGPGQAEVVINFQRAELFFSFRFFFGGGFEGKEELSRRVDQSPQNGHLSLLIFVLNIKSRHCRSAWKAFSRPAPVQLCEFSKNKFQP